MTNKQEPMSKPCDAVTLPSTQAISSPSPNSFTRTPLGTSRAGVLSLVAAKAARLFSDNSAGMGATRPEPSRPNCRAWVKLMTVACRHPSQYCDTEWQASGYYWLPRFRVQDGKIISGYRVPIRRTRLGCVLVVASIGAARPSPIPKCTPSFAHSRRVGPPMHVTVPPKRRHLQHRALVILTEAKGSTALRTCHPDRSAAKWRDLRSRPSPKRKTKYLCARILKLNFKGMIRDRLRLPDQLIQPLFLDRAVALFVNVAPVRCTRRRPSISTRYRTEDPRTAGPITICRSRA